MRGPGIVAGAFLLALIAAHDALASARFGAEAPLESGEAWPQEIPAEEDRSGDPISPRPFQRFGHDLKKSFAGIFLERSLVPLPVGLGGGIAAASADDEVAGYILESNGLPDINRAGDWAAHAEVIAGGAGAPLLAGSSLRDERLRQAAYAVTQALVLNNAISFGLKPIVTPRRRAGRPGPPDVDAQHCTRPGADRRPAAVPGRSPIAFRSVLHPGVPTGKNELTRPR